MHRMKKQPLAVLLLLGMLLGCHGQYAALFREGSPEPVCVFPYRIAAFPQADRQALRAGIPITDRAQLNQLLADFFS